MGDRSRELDAAREQTPPRNERISPLFRKVALKGFVTFTSIKSAGESKRPFVNDEVVENDWDQDN